MFKTLSVFKSKFPGISIVWMAGAFTWLRAFWLTIEDYPVFLNDFRNRIVGARLMQDGKDPYFYIWAMGKPIRYYDNGINPLSPFSNITSTPFVHWILGPICNLPQSQLNVFWFMLQWVCMIVCTLLAMRITAHKNRQAYVFLGAGLMLLSIGMRHHFVQMQTYLLIPVLMLIGVYGWLKHRNGFTLMLTGICFASVILIRPTLPLLIAPLAWLPHWRKPLYVTAIVLAIYACFVVINPMQRSNWKQFAVMMHDRDSLMHQPEATPAKFEWLSYKTCEGLDLSNNQIVDRITKRLYTNKTEDGNYKYVHLRLFGTWPSKPLMLGLQLFTILVFAGGSYYLSRFKSGKSWMEMLLVGFTCYWFFEFFSDISSKLLYYYSIFLYVVLLQISVTEKFRIVPFCLLLTGLLFNIYDVPIPVNGNIGQGLIMLSFFIDMFLRRRDDQKHPTE